MDVRAHFHEVAQQRKVLPIGSDLVLHERDDPEAIRRDGEALGKVIVEAAERYDTKVAFPLMDLQIEKEYLLSLVGIEPDEIAKYHFGDEGIEAEVRERVERGVSGDYVTEKMKGTLGALEYVANTPDLIPVGMSIGPFSFLTKLIDDPITNVYLAAQGEEDDEEAILVKDVLEVATMVIDRWLKLQIEAGAKAIVVCEPAANVVYLSPNS
jgi:uroporphyrinogen-III decarboxylase